ncbi:MAG: transposase family protein [Verrucomicrobiales bacterium]
MDISEQTVRAHYGELLGVGSDWEVVKVEIDHVGRELRAWVEWKEGRRLKCPECGKVCPGYDRMEQRTWRHLDACGYTTLLQARVPRGKCARHGVLA